LSFSTLCKVQRNTADASSDHSAPTDAGREVYPKTVMLGAGQILSNLPEFCCGGRMVMVIRIFGRMKKNITEE
jgi:hypothetical protein